MPFEKGKSGNPAGRAPGAVNKTTASVKEALQLAFEGIGGVPNLIAWAKDNTTEFYKLYAKLLPVQVDASVQHNFAMVVPAVADTAEQWQAQNPQVTIQTVQ